MLKNIHKILVLIPLIFLLPNCAATQVYIPVHNYTPYYYYLTDNPVDDYFNNEYERYNDSASAIADEAMAYADAWKLEMEHAYSIIRDNLTDPINIELLEKSLITFDEYVNSELDIMATTFNSMYNDHEYPVYGSNISYELQLYRAELYKVRCNKLYEYVSVITNGNYTFYHS